MFSDKLIVLLWCHGIGNDKRRALSAFLRACPKPQLLHVLPNFNPSRAGRGVDRSFEWDDHCSEWVLTISETLDFFRDPDRSGPASRDRLHFNYIVRKAGWTHVQRLQKLGHIPERDWRAGKAAGRTIHKRARHDYETLEEEWHCRTRLAKKPTSRR